MGFCLDARSGYSPWAQYHGEYDRHQKRLQQTSQPILYQTPFASPQLEMFGLDDEQWLKVHQRSYQRQQKRIKRMARQLRYSIWRSPSSICLYFLEPGCDGSWAGGLCSLGLQAGVCLVETGEAANGWMDGHVPRRWEHYPEKKKQRRFARRV